MDSCYNKNNLLNYLEENTLIWLISSFTFAVIFIFIYILKAYTFFDKRRIPQTVHPTAPFGNIKDVLFQETTLYIYLWKCYNKFKRKGLKYGGLYLFFKPSVLVVDSVIMQMISAEQKYESVGHRKYFSKNSKVLNLFTEEILENFVIKYNNIKDTSLMNLQEKCISTVLHHFFMETTSSAFGFKIGLDDLPVVNALLNKKTISGFKYYFDLVYPLFERNIYPNSEMQNLIQDIVEDRKKRDLREKDLIQSFIDSYNKGDYNFNEMILDIFDIFVDNIMYSYSTLMFCLFELASNKDIQQNLIQEIKTFNDQNKSVELKDLQELSYMDAVVKEILRKYPPIPLIMKKCKEHCKIDGIDLELPEDTFILYSVMGVHYDPLNYLEPEKFYPDRFVEEFHSTDVSHVYIPFGLDIRKEIGHSLEINNITKKRYIFVSIMISLGALFYRTMAAAAGEISGFRFIVLHIKLGLISIFSSYSVNLRSKCTMEFDNKKLTIYPKEPLPIIFEPLLK